MTTCWIPRCLSRSCAFCVPIRISPGPKVGSATVSVFSLFPVLPSLRIRHRPVLFQTPSLKSSESLPQEGSRLPYSPLPPSFAIHGLTWSVQSTLAMSSPKILFMPSGLAAFTCCLAVASLFAASGAIGCYYVWGRSISASFKRIDSDAQCPAAHQHVEPYKSESSHVAIIAGIQAGFSILIVGESVYG